MRINTNVSSLVAQEASVNTSKNLSVSLEKLSSGLRINKASDDASGLAIADKLRTQATSINQGISNGNSAITLLQIADKSMSEQSSILDTIKAKLIQANTNTTSSDGRESIRKDVKKLLEQLDNIAEQTNYNGNVLLQKSATDKAGSTDLSFQVGETNRDIITNTSIQSNTDGLGSRTSYGKSSAIANGASKLVAATGAITIKASGTTSTEKVTVSGSINSLTLAVGAKISDVDTATKAKLDALVTSGQATLSGSTYTIGSTAKTLDLSAISNVKATIETPKSESFSATTVATGQVVDVRGVTLTTGSNLKTSLADNNLFTKLTTGVYVAVKAATISELKTGESFKLVSTTNVAQGSSSSAFDAGDVIKVNSKVTGGLLDKSLNTTGMFKKNSDGTFTVLKSFTAGNLRLMTGESISVTQGVSASLGSNATSGHIATGLKLTALKYNPGGNTASATTVFQATSNFNNVFKTAATTATGSQLYTAGKDTLSFTVTASGQISTSAVNFSVKQGDIIKLATAEVASSGKMSLSSGLMSTTDFIAIGSGKFQALKNTTVKMDGTDSINVTRLAGGVSTPSVHTFDATGVTTKDKSLTDQTISLTSTKGVSITNNSGAAEALTISSTAEMSNGKNALSSLSGLAEGGLTADISSSFQSVVDDAITKLNGYRGDIGSTQNQVESAVRNLMTQATNVKAAESIIRDVDYAAESANFNKQNIISQAGSYAISQSNAVQQNVLRLLQ